jgi:outer membrane protein assembly factor BamE
MRKLLISLLFIASLQLISGCVPYYRPDIQQGNVVSQDMVDRLRPGMSKHQVQYILGTPLLVDVFHQERWDYYYSFEGQMSSREQKRLSIFFENGRLARIAGDYRPKVKSDPLAEGQRELHSVPDYEERTKGYIRRTWDDWRDDEEEPEAEAEPEEIVSVPDQERAPEEEKGFFGSMWDKVGLGDDEEEAQVQYRQQPAPEPEPAEMTAPRERAWQDPNRSDETAQQAAPAPAVEAKQEEEEGFFSSMWSKVGFGDDEEEAAPEPTPQAEQPEQEAVSIAPYRSGIQDDEPVAPAAQEPEAAAVEEVEPLIKQQQPEEEERGFFGSMWDKVSFGSDEEEAATEEAAPEGAAPVEGRSTGDDEEEKGFFGSMWDAVSFGDDDEETEE